ncbi:hypothetical protein J2W48_000268 [Flavobacterium piscis]|uniref:Uncharacterized protein n=1 Tax=Flavobacterium piscis TaxID=1114874 RepID=A0ABU1Y298_9FLAO|nr:hypothetical protein [Flavobacterium piscis]
MDSVEFNRKSNKYIIYKYYGNIKVEHKNQRLISKYELGKNKKWKMNWIYTIIENMGFYNSLPKIGI